MSFKSIRLLIMFPIAILMVVALCVPFHTTARESVAAELMAIAQESLTAQYQVLVTGDVTAGFRGKRFGRLFRDAIEGQLSSHVTMRNALKQKRLDFKGFRTKLVFQGLTITGDNAQLKAIEITELDMNPPPGGPKVTKSSDPHVFDFVKTNGEWKLVNDLIVRPKPVFSQNGEDLPIVPLPPPTTDQPTDKRSIRKHHASLSSRRFAVNPFPVNYDRVAAIDYAKAHALSYNTAYKRFNNDCTNFISQSLFAGGWQMVLGFYTHNDVWWYSCALPGGYVCKASYTWGAAFNFHAFLGTSPGQRTNMASHFGDVWPGDIIFADWDSPSGHTPDGRMDHIMFVTGRDTDGNLYISQHTNDRLDRPMAQVILAEPAANFYGFKVKDSY